jgi:hypothetical protein
VLVLNRDAKGTTFYGRGRDIEEIETAMRFDGGCGRSLAMPTIGVYIEQPCGSRASLLLQLPRLNDLILTA